MSDETDARTTRLILVPGTWGLGFFAKAIEPHAIVSEKSPTTGEANKRQKRLRWFDSGSEFREQLASSLAESKINYTTRIFLWDGHNSVVSRNKAAIALAELIGRLTEDASNDPIVIIAHSHGGNVALRAVHIAGAKGMAIPKVITLATPFVRIYTNTIFEDKETSYSSPLKDNALSFLLISLSAVLGLPFAAAILIPAAMYLDAMRAMLQPIIFIDPIYVAIITALVLGLFVGGVFAQRLLKLVVNPHPVHPDNWGREGGSESWGYRPDRLANYSFYAPPQVSENWLLVLRGVDDEASLTLAAGSIGNRVTHFILGTLLPNAYQILAAVGTLLVVASMAGWTSQSAAGMVALGYGAVAFVAALVLILPGLFRSVFGRELLFGSWRCEIAANSSPDGANGVEVQTLLGRPESSKEKLRHSLYMNADVPRCIAKWLQRSAMSPPRH